MAEYNTARPHQSCGGRPPIERFRLADRSLAADDTAAAEPRAGPVPRRGGGKRPAGVSRWVNAAGKISLAGFTYCVGATYAGEPVEVVVAGGPGGHPARRGRGRHPRPAAARGPGRPGAAGPGRPAGPGRHRRADGDPAGQRHRRDHLRRQDLPGRAALGPHASIDVTIVAGSVQLSKDGQVIRVHPIRHDRTSELGAFANPKGRARRKNSAIGRMSPSYRNSLCRPGTGT